VYITPSLSVITFTRLVILSGAEGPLVLSYQLRLRSSHFGFTDSMSAIFFARVQPFNCFSRLIALRTSSNLSKYSRRSTPYFEVKPGNS